MPNLTRGEELHALRSWLWFGSDGLIRRKQEEDQSESARCLTLLTSAVLL
ncbi:Tn3 transposase DDE domain-containing protein [Spirosoma oryzae]|uniref:Tn3 transposase DDE domain-containing protein n=1 Tax=Spirosoma oryzae TaxID=1469603 RepID=A0A2T0S3E8_9BACT|nr:Tn3 transposase DDE domain-containing protein [Spirosoma oryzae]